MYDNPCKPCENYAHCMHTMNMPMHGYTMPMVETEDEDLKKLYPRRYVRIYPMVRQQCDMMESRLGTMYSPTKEEVDNIVKQTYEKYEEYYGKEEDKDEDDDYRNDDEDMRQRRRRGRRRPIQDLVRILFIRDLLGRRRRRRPYYGYWY